MTTVCRIIDWPDRVSAIVEAIGGPLTIGRVVADCDSTQDVARSLGPGSLVVAHRQRAGRGQRGNRWHDTGTDGLAFSLCLSATDDPMQSRVLAEVIVKTFAPRLGEGLHVKPPNDVLWGERKLAGILIEQADGLAVIGIGINVSQTHWPDELKDTAVSLRQAGVTIDRLDVLACILPPVVARWMA